MKIMIKIKKQLMLLILFLSAFFCSCETADSRYAERINAIQENYRQCLREGNFRIVHVKYKESCIFEEDFPDSLIQQNSVAVTEKEEQVLRECIKLLSLWDDTYSPVPSCWEWDNEYWVLCEGKKILEIGPNGQNVPLSISSQIFWSSAYRELQGAFRRARKKTVHN